ncbi:sensor domain-containing diguanylate cyclase [Pararhodospirillum photometricum]|nr:GGDEF domain-containing protein [Pararhodospirillum photometricum]
MFAALAGAGLWLTVDLRDSRTRLLQERSDLALQKSQFMSQWFGTTLVAVDYVLRDIQEKLGPDDLPAPSPDRQRALGVWLQEKAASVPGVVGISVYGADCVFVAAADPHLIGFKSHQKICDTPDPALDQHSSIQYIPAEKSASRRPSILISRNNITADGTLQGGVLAAIDLSFTQSWISSIVIDPSEVVALVDGEGTLLARNPPLPTAIGRRAPLPPQPAFGRQRSSITFEATSPWDNRRRTYALSKIENIPMVLIVGFDLEGSLGEWERRAWQLAGGLLALVILAALALHAHLVAVRQREDLRILATTDALTGVANRRQFMTIGSHEVARARRYTATLAVFMVDIDHFKTINDTWGHPTGDRAIQALASTMAAVTRDLDVVGRLGGEEFAIILPETDAQGALILADRLRSTVEQQTTVLSTTAHPVRLTVSIGVTTLQPADTGFEDLLGRADKALYAAKAAGRNRVVSLSDPGPVLDPAQDGYQTR